MSSQIVWRKKYNEVIHSFRWRYLRRRLIAMRGYRCQRCKSMGTLQLHHKTYKRLGKELDEDLEVLCIACHKLADKKRKQQADDRLYEARVNGWANKVYGDDWAEYECYENIVLEFEEWMERKAGC